MGHAVLENKEAFFISTPGDVTGVRRKARSKAEDVGFDKVAAEEVALVVSELSSNLHKHANQGVLSITPLEDGPRKGLQIEASDKGPGIPDMDSAFVDGFSSAGTLGDGLGSVNRLMDTMEVVSDDNCGTHIICQKWLPQVGSATTHKPNNPYDVGAASRSHPGMQVNGDAFIIKHWPGHTLIAVIDGVGHGQYAHKASTTARKYIETHYQQSLDDIFLGTARACRGTRGVVMALADLDWQTNTFKFASVGNIESKTYNTTKDKMFSIRRGIVGLKMPKPRISTETWEKGGLMIFFSDGIPSHFPSTDITTLAHQPASTIARKILNKHCKAHDDATVLIVKGRENSV